MNGTGGRLLIGVDGKGKPVGVPDAATAARGLEGKLAEAISPRALWSVQVRELDDLVLVEIDVPAGMDKPYVVGGAIYGRRGDRVVTATRDEISALIQERLKTGQRWERRLVPGVERSDLDERLIEETTRMAVESRRWSGSPPGTDSFLQAHGLIEGESVTHAALLLFGKAPTRWLPQARIRLLVMPEGKTGDRYSLDQSFDECLLRAAEQIAAALARVSEGVVGRFSEDWKRDERVFYPMSALREGVMNALVHRDYEQHASITISIRPGSLSISNPGGLPDPLTPADLRRDHASLPRNPDIAHMCFLYRLIEKVGRGTQRIVEDCRTARLPSPKWQSSISETTLRFFAPTSPTTKAGEVELNERQEQILALLREGKPLGAGELVKQLGRGVSDRTLRTYLSTLVEMGLLVRRGKGRQTAYILGRKAGS